MAKVKRGNVLKNRHKKILKYAKGFRGSNSKLFIAANQTIMKAWRNAFRDRRKRKRVFRRLWISRINAACRKLLSELAVNDKAAFTKLVEVAKQHAPKN